MLQHFFPGTKHFQKHNFKETSFIIVHQSHRWPPLWTSRWNQLLQGLKHCTNTPQPGVSKSIHLYYTQHPLYHLLVYLDLIIRLCFLPSVFNDCLQFVYYSATCNHYASCCASPLCALQGVSQKVNVKYNVKVFLHVLFLKVAYMCVWAEYYPPWPDSLHRLVLIGISLCTHTLYKTSVWN